MTNEKKTFLISLFNTAVFLILVLFHYSGASIKIGGANPMSALALLVAIIMFSSELGGVLTGTALGIVLDSVSAAPTGFNTVTLIIISFSASLVSHYLFNKNLKSAITLCFICALVYFGARWLVGFAFAGDIEGSFDYLMRYAVPSAIYTTVFIIPFFYMEMHLFSKIKRL